MILKTRREAALVWALRKAGLSLMTGRKGPAKPTTCIEDTAVRPQDLPDYVNELQKLMAGHRLEASYYGHAAAGLLHVRPILDLHRHSEVRKMRELSSEVSALVRQFKGSLAAEHGVGIARTEFMGEQIGETLLNVMAEIKASFDPHNLFNPGKIIPDGRYEIDSDLRTHEHTLDLPFTPVLAYAAKDESFTANLEQCNGCGGCRKMTPSMCPTFIVSGDELLSTRGRANVIRSVLSGRGANGEKPAVLQEELEAALGSCLSCRACAVECPSNVNLALLKADLQHARIQSRGLSARERLFSSIDLLGRLGTVAPWLANRAQESIVVRRLLTKTLDLAWQRPLPAFARQRFDRWFTKRTSSTNGTRGEVILWDDTFVRYYEPHIGMAAVRVLEAAGYDVRLVDGRACCGRPAFSQGNLDEAARLGRHNLDLLSREQSTPILFLEPSCYSMFLQDYAELKLPGAKQVAARCFLFEQFLDALLGQEPEALKFRSRPGRIVIHAHCHVKAVMSADFLGRLAGRLPQREVHLLNTACCGMAGAFGALEKNYELSLKVAEPLVAQLRLQPFGTAVVASGASCRHQIDHLTPFHARHMAEVLAEALPTPVWV
jgi:Fe-S oxidoreductase